ncbi:hypothetical protein CEXT_557001 [Caerostris extrusa]|uniref:Uncharacterized protein n=1 Tax=Caerostris extrusa TaxID=172846 RepID=A0AAV4W955_CAEEX|nr:hypothetical protein CEXT_557001 [Caerostris extrusa]
MLTRTDSGLVARPESFAATFSMRFSNRRLRSASRIFCFTSGFCLLHFLEDYDKCFHIAPVGVASIATANYNKYFGGNNSVSDGMRPLQKGMCAIDDMDNVFEALSTIEREMKEFERQTITNPLKIKTTFELQQAKVSMKRILYS